MNDQAKQLTDQALAVCDDLQNYTIATADKYEIAAKDLKMAKEMIKAIDDKRKEMTRPLDESKKKIMDFFRPVTTRLNSVVSKINVEMSSFRRKQEEIARQKNEAADEETGGEDMFVPQAEPAIPKTEVRVRKTWKFKVVDKNKIDAKFLIPDEKTIRELVSKLKEKAVDIVGGIEVYCEETSY